MTKRTTTPNLCLKSRLDMASAKRVHAQNPVFRRRGDDHLQLVIDENLSLCQMTMGVKIEDAKNASVKAHGRVDVLEDRVMRLDDPEVGKVTKLWDDREYVQKAVRRILVYMFFSVALAGGAGYYLRPDPVLDKMALKQAIKDAVVELKKSGDVP